MSETPTTTQKVPDGKSAYLTTKQKEPNEKGFVGFETNWEPWHKEIEYTTPKRP